MRCKAMDILWALSVFAACLILIILLESTFINSKAATAQEAIVEPEQTGIMVEAYAERTPREARQVEFVQFQIIEDARPDAPLSADLMDVLTEACEVNGIPVHIALGLIYTASRFNGKAVSPAGCYGLCQLNPRYFPSGLSDADNIRHGMDYLGRLLGKYGSIEAALCAYHDGHDTGRRDYSSLVLTAAERWRT